MLLPINTVQDCCKQVHAVVVQYSIHELPVADTGGAGEGGDFLKVCCKS